MSRPANTPQQESRTPPDDVLVFGPFELDPGRATLACRGTELPLRPKCFDLLSYLVERSGRLVAKEELIAAVWPGLVVTDSSLSQCIVEIRRALGTEGRSLIRTVPRRGYCFESTVKLRPAIPPTKSTRFPSNLGNSRVWFVAVLTLILMTALGFAINNLASPAATSQQANSIAREEYLLGRYFQDRRSRGDVERSIGYFRRAIKLDPGQADAWVGLAASIFLDARLGGATDLQAATSEFKAALDYALELDPDHAEAHARIIHYYAATGHPELVEQHLKQALQNGQSNSVVLAIAAGEAFKQHDLPRAIELQTRALELKPYSYVDHSNLGIYFFLAGNPARARHHLEIARDLNPGGGGEFDGTLVQSMVLMGDYSAAAAFANRMEEGPDRDQALAFVYDARGDAIQRDVYLGALVANTSALSALRMAEYQSFQGNQVESRDWLMRSLRLKSREISGQCYNNFLNELQNSPFLVNSLNGTLLADTGQRSGA